MICGRLCFPSSYNSRIVLFSSIFLRPTSWYSGQSLLVSRWSLTRCATFDEHVQAWQEAALHDTESSRHDRAADRKLASSVTRSVSEPFRFPLLHHGGRKRQEESIRSLEISTKVAQRCSLMEAVMALCTQSDSADTCLSQG